MMTADEIASEVERLAGKGILEAGYFLEEQIQELISVPAPYRITKSGRFVATTPAIPGAPPRRLSGALRRSGFVRQVSDNEVEVVFATPYAHWLEFDTSHQFMTTALDRHLEALGRIVGEVVTGEVVGTGETQSSGE